MRRIFLYGSNIQELKYVLHKVDNILCRHELMPIFVGWPMTGTK